MRIFISNLPPGTEETEVMVLFRQYGQVDLVRLTLSHGIIEMPDETEAADAIRQLDGLRFGDRIIQVKESNIVIYG